MKYRIFIFILFLFSCKNEIKLAECCFEKNGRCNGSAYCSACTNCSRCAYCKNGGKCGVCSNKKPKKNIYSAIPLNLKNIKPSDHLFVNVENAYFRAGAGKEYDTIQLFKRNSILIYISSDGEWIKAKSLDSGLIGYIHFGMLRQ